jgi:hypothetical protein
MKQASSLTPETIQDLERCCTELLDVYHRAMETAKALEQRAWTAQLEWARMQGEWLREAVRGNEQSADAKKIQKAALAERDRYERNRAKFRGKANLYRRQAETVLKVLQWAAPNKYRALNETQWMPLRPSAKDVSEQQRQIRDLSSKLRNTRSEGAA